VEWTVIDVPLVFLLQRFQLVLGFPNQTIDIIQRHDFRYLALHFQSTRNIVQVLPELIRQFGMQ
jgi:hypothetical protein